MPALTAAALASLTHAMENMAFVEVEPLPDPDQLPPDPATCWFGITFADPLGGRMILGFAPELLEDISATLFAGLPEASTMGDDAAKELANTVAGHLCSTLVPPNTTFALGLPERLEQPPAGLPLAACLCNGMALWLGICSPLLKELAEEMPSEMLGTEQTPGWGEAPAPDPATGRWPVDESRRWGKG